MKALILTLAVTGFMTSAHAGVYNKNNDAKIHNMSKQECPHKASGALMAKTNPQKQAYKGNRVDTKAKNGISR